MADSSSWVFALTHEERTRAIEIISRGNTRSTVEVRRRGRSARPWVILVDGAIETDIIGRPRRFKTRKSALAKAALRRSSPER